MYYIHSHYSYLQHFPTRRSSDLELQCLKISGLKNCMKNCTQLFFQKLFQKKIINISDLGLGFHLRGSMTGSVPAPEGVLLDRKSTRLNSSHVKISYAVFCLKKKK